MVYFRERDPDVIENHNLFGFDLPFLEQRAAILGIPLNLGREGGPPLLERRAETLAIGPEARRRTRYSIAGRELIDTLDAVRRHDFVVRDMPSYSLKDVARYFDIASPDRVYLEGPAIFDTYQRDPERVRQYALDDVAEVDGLSQRLLGAPFALASMAPRRYERLASAGPAIRNRTLPVSDLGARVRLSKTTEAYLAARASHPEPQYEALLAAGRTRWYPGERVRFYRTRKKTYAWLPDETEESPASSDWEAGSRESTEPVEQEIRANGQGDDITPDIAPDVTPLANAFSPGRETVANRRDYDVEHYLSVLVTSYAARLRKAFAPGDFEQLFRLDEQPGLFDSLPESIVVRADFSGLSN